MQTVIVEGYKGGVGTLIGPAPIHNGIRGVWLVEINGKVERVHQDWFKGSKPGVPAL